MTTAMTTLTLDSDPAKIADLQFNLDGLCRDAGLDDFAALKLTTAIVEAVSNSIKHGYRGEPGHPITVDWCCDEDRVYIEIRDRAQPPPANFLDHPEMPSPDAVSGRGLRIILEWTDSAHYARDGDENVLNLTGRR